MSITTTASVAKSTTTLYNNANIHTTIVVLVRVLVECTIRWIDELSFCKFMNKAKYNKTKIILVLVLYSCPRKVSLSLSLCSNQHCLICVHYDGRFLKKRNLHIYHICKPFIIILDSVQSLYSLLSTVYMITRSDNRWFRFIWPTHTQNYSLLDFGKLVDHPNRSSIVQVYQYPPSY